MCTCMCMGGRGREKGERLAASGAFAKTTAA